MRAIVKDTACPLCLALLVVDNGTITCTDGHELQQDLPWHNETWSKLKPVIDWMTSVGDRQ